MNFKTLGFFYQLAWFVYKLYKRSKKMLLNVAVLIAKCCVNAGKNPHNLASEVCTFDSGPILYFPVERRVLRGCLQGGMGELLLRWLVVICYS